MSHMRTTRDRAPLTTTCADLGDSQSSKTARRGAGIPAAANLARRRRDDTLSKAPDASEQYTATRFLAAKARSQESTKNNRASRAPRPGV
eukprot:9485652-Pyramimonas_sp.AAC.1